VTWQSFCALFLPFGPFFSRDAGTAGGLGHCRGLGKGEAAGGDFGKSCATELFLLRYGIISLALQNYFSCATEKNYSGHGIKILPVKIFIHTCSKLMPLFKIFFPTHYK